LDLPTAQCDAHPRDRGLAAADAPDVGRLGSRGLGFGRRRGFGGLFSHEDLSLFSVAGVWRSGDHMGWKSRFTGHEPPTVIRCPRALRGCVFARIIARTSPKA